mmetsp:Transcript_61980/g.171792  ORF Transcript_61980/g.171792 Transcript_61980/m.171792 type:complete len:238 (+) Transcript_61980:737-1450(+)
MGRLEERERQQLLQEGHRWACAEYCPADRGSSEPGQDLGTGLRCQGHLLERTHHVKGLCRVDLEAERQHGVLIHGALADCPHEPGHSQCHARSDKRQQPPPSAQVAPAASWPPAALPRAPPCGHRGGVGQGPEPAGIDGGAHGGGTGGCPGSARPGGDRRLGGAGPGPGLGGPAADRREGAVWRADLRVGRQVLRACRLNHGRRGESARLVASHGPRADTGCSGHRGKRQQCGRAEG